MNALAIQLTLTLLFDFGLPSAMARDQSSVVSAGSAREVTWRATGGYDWFALRDVARTGIPVDASPVGWQGGGATFLLEHTRALSARFHRFQLHASFDGRFAYATGLQATAADGSDHMRRVEGRYQYRRYVFDDVGLDGLDLGVGVQAIGARSSVRRVVPVAIEFDESMTTIAPAIAAAARVHRWAPLRIEVAWINGLALAHLSEHHSSDEAATRTRWGGGWLTDLVLSADIAVGGGWSVAVTYSSVDDGLLSSHRSWTSDRRWLTVGVAYAK